MIFVTFFTHASKEKNYPVDDELDVVKKKSAHRRSRSCVVSHLRALLLQSYRNTVPVPRHWCQKRKYLQGKRGIEKTPFELPEFIAMTGIDKIRAAIEEADSLKKVPAWWGFRCLFGGVRGTGAGGMRQGHGGRGQG